LASQPTLRAERNKAVYKHVKDGEQSRHVFVVRLAGKKSTQTANMQQQTEQNEK